MRDRNSKSEHEKWGQVVVSAQFVIALVVFLTEVVNNLLLYVTRSQGYGPDTIIMKLLRYLVLTSSVNFVIYIMSRIVESRDENEKRRRFLLLFFTTLMCTNVAFSHYQFASALAIFVVPIIISIMYEDWKLSVFTLAVSLGGETVAVVARATDSGYNKDIGPEAAIAYSLVISVFIFAKLIYGALENRRNEVRQAVIEAEKANLANEKMVFSFRMLETLAGTIDAKDRYTNGHSMRVAIYATKLADSLGWDADRVAQLRYEAILHDIGKIGVPDIILNKPAKLSQMEFDLVKSHTVVGSNILKNMVAVPGAAEVARSHHERYDGTGYPSGLKGNEISENARIVCIADAYDAMSSDRIYRKALGRDVIRHELVDGRGTQFDPELLDEFLDLFDEDQLEITNDELFINTYDPQQQSVLEDIEMVIGKLASMEEQRSSLTEFDKFYDYMKNIGMRYNRSIEVLSIDVVTEPVEIHAEIEEKEKAVSDILQMVIRKNIRAVDVYYKYSNIRHMIILLDAGVDNIDVIRRRIQYDFDQSNMCDDFRLSFSLHESIAAPKH